MLLCMYDQIYLHILRPKTGGAIIRAGATIGTNTELNSHFDFVIFF